MVTVSEALQTAGVVIQWQPMTTADTKKPRDEILIEVFRRMKSQSALARALSRPEHSISRAAVCQWRRIPEEHVREIAELTGIALRRLRPDLYAPR